MLPKSVFLTLCRAEGEGPYILSALRNPLPSLNTRSHFVPVYFGMRPNPIHLSIFPDNSRNNLQ
jgi:hypothetical protein